MQRCSSMNVSNYSDVLKSEYVCGSESERERETFDAKRDRNNC